MSTKVVIRYRRRDDLDSLFSVYGQQHEDDDPLPDQAEVEKISRVILSDRGEGFTWARSYEKLS